MKKRNPFLINFIVTILYIFLIYKTSIIEYNIHFYIALFLLYPTVQIIMLSKSRGFTVLLKSTLFFMLYFSIFSIINYAFIETISKQVHSRFYFSLAITISIVSLVSFFTISMPVVLHFFKTEIGVLDILLLLLNIFLIYIELKLIGSDILMYYQYFLVVFILFLILYIIRHALIFRKWSVPLKSAGILFFATIIFFMNNIKIIQKNSNLTENEIKKMNSELKSTEEIKDINIKDKRTTEDIKDKKPNILLITVDCLTPYHMELFGYERETSPNLTKFSKDSLFFKKAFSQGNNTLPSIGSLMTSKYTTEILWKDYKRFLPIKEENLLLAEILKDNGYHTIAFTTHSYFLPNLGFQQGFENWDISLVSTKAEIAFEQETSIALFEKSKVIMDNLPDNRPFFMWLHFFDPHDSYLKRDEAIDFGNTEKDIFDNEINYTDIYIGKLLEYLKEKKLYDNTIIIITGDHGEGFGLHGYEKHGKSLYNDQIWIPLLIRFPDMKPQVIEQEVSHIDIFPTLIEYLNIDLPNGRELSGISLFDRVGNSENPPVYAMNFRQGKEEYSMIYKGYKIIYFYKQNVKKIYNIQDDFNEKKELSNESPEILYDLSKKISVWIKKQKDSYKSITSRID